MYNIICNHIFQDGNKRTGLESALLFLQLNNHDLVIEDEPLTQFTLDVASSHHSPEFGQEWFKAHIQPL